MQYIIAKTGFDPKGIELISSKQSEGEDGEYDTHMFYYNGKKYLLKKDDLKVVE